MDQPFSERISELKENQLKFNQDLHALEAERDQAPERLRGAFEAAIANLESSQQTSLESYLTSEEVVSFIEEQAAQARADIAAIENLAQRKLITDEQRKQYIAELFQTDDYADFLVITTTAFEIFEEDKNPFKINVLLATATEEEDTNEISTDHENQVTEVDVVANDAFITEKVLITQEQELTEIDDPKDDNLEVIEVVYATGQNRFFINGVEISETTYRHTVSTRMSLIKSIASLEAGVPTKPGTITKIAQEQFDLNATQAAVRSSMDWVLEKIKTSDGKFLAEHNGGWANAAKITRSLGVSAVTKIVDIFPSSQESKQAVIEPLDYQIDKDSDPTEQVLDLRDNPISEDDGEDIADITSLSRDVYSVDKLIQPEFLDHLSKVINHLKMKLQFNQLVMPDSVFERANGQLLQSSQLDIDLLHDAAQLISDSISQSDDLISMQLELFEIENPSDDVKFAIKLLDDLDNMCRAVDVERIVMPAHIDMAVDEIIDENKDSLQSSEIKDSELRKLLNVIELQQQIEPVIHELLVEMGNTIKSELSTGTIERANIGLNRRDLAAARSAGILDGGNSNHNRSSVSVELLIAVSVYKRTRNSSLNANQVRQLSLDILREYLEKTQ